MRQHQEMTEKLQKTDAALEKVEEALQCVSEMKSELEEKEKVLAAETAKTDDALKVVGLIQLLFFVSWMIATLHVNHSISVFFLT